MSGNLLPGEEYARLAREREKVLPTRSGLGLTPVQCQELERCFKSAWDDHGDGGDRPMASRTWYTAVLALIEQYGYTLTKDLTKIGGC